MRSMAYIICRLVQRISQKSRLFASYFDAVNPNLFMQNDELIEIFQCYGCSLELFNKGASFTEPIKEQIRKERPWVIWVKRGPLLYKTVKISCQPNDPRQLKRRSKEELRIEEEEEGRCAASSVSHRSLLYNQQFSLYSLFYKLLFGMHPQDSLEDDIITIKPRDYKCPCGKSYLSYAALFTHIKQKHEGKAPGKITKPPSQHEKRGRPPVKPKQDKKEPEKADTDIPPPVIDPLFPPETEEQRTLREAAAQESIRHLVAILDSMPRQHINKSHLNEIQVFSEMNVYLNTRTTAVSHASGNICIADGFIEFAQIVCSQIQWWQFQPFYLLFMLFLQYIIDEQNSKKILRDSNMDLFCEYINDFIEEHVHQMAEYYDFDGHEIIRKNNCIAIFYHFFTWCTNKRYITYRINLSNTSSQPQAQPRPQPQQQPLLF